LSQRNIFKNVRNNFSCAAVARCRLLPAAAGGENHLWSFRGMFTNCIRLVCVKNLSITAKNLQLIWVKYPNHIIKKTLKYYLFELVVKLRRFEHSPTHLPLVSRPGVYLNIYTILNWTISISKNNNQRSHMQYKTIFI